MTLFIISDLIKNGWIGQGLCQALDDGHFESIEDLIYFFQNVFLPLFTVSMLAIFSMIIDFLLILLFLYVVICIIRFIYYQSRQGNVIHLYPPKK